MGKPRASQKVATRSATPKKAADTLIGLINEIISSLLEGKAPTEKRLNKLLGELASGTFCLIPIESRTVTKVVTRVRDRIIREIVPAFQVSAAPRLAVVERHPINKSAFGIFDYGGRESSVFFSPASTAQGNIGGFTPRSSLNEPLLTKDEALAYIRKMGRQIDISEITTKLIRVEIPGADRVFWVSAKCYRRVVSGLGPEVDCATVKEAIPIGSRVDTGLPRIPPPPLPPPAPPPGLVQVIAPGPPGVTVPGGRIPILGFEGELEFATGYTPPEKRRR